MKRKSYPSQLKSKLEKIMWICLFWILISLLQFFNGYSTMIYLEFDISELDPIPFMAGAVFTGLIAGLIGGSTMVFFWEQWLRTKSYGSSLLSIFWSYTLVFFTVALLTGLFFHAGQLHTHVFDIRVWNEAWQDSFSAGQVQNYIFWLLVVIITLIGLLVNDKYGPGIFVSFLLGRYFHPRREDRIFMFLDLKGSTTIAEKLGEERYFNFLKDTYSDATPGILESKGEIYQYVGDEIVVSWKPDSGKENINALQCFFDIQQRLLDRSAYYRAHYAGILPEFKAGLHYGFVTAGEIGVVKRDIVYSGDVMNTTARIQGKCNELGVNILLSKSLLDKLGTLQNLFEPTEMGQIALRGKQDAMMLYTV